MTHWIVTANRLSDGSVAYLGADRGWTSRLEEARRWPEREDADASLAWARHQEHVICDPYVFEVTLEDGRPVPRSARERIRAEGPRPTLERLGLAGLTSHETARALTG
ncbi:MAG TPA: DUF2849 domain-containing protein [Sandaracinaceae bacterium LLY-WYZ-13_1]|nr:DUF2849 domain-containing protein [Sandaracinaceae bacterium LLY-WYZ-13_1]